MIKTLEDLQEFKEQKKDEIGARERRQRAKILIGMGTCGIAAGAQEVLDAINDELQVRKIDDVTITQTGCIGLCAKEPWVEVLMPGKTKVIYGNVDSSKARQIIAHHVVNGMIVSQWVVNKEEV